MKAFKAKTNYIPLFGSFKLNQYLNDLDEFKVFDSCLQEIERKDISIYEDIISSLSQSKQKYINVIRNFKKIQINNNTVKFRKIVKIKRSNK